MADIDRVTGYHGTSRQQADQILSRGFRASQNDYDWLGNGIYFWERAPVRAEAWARDVADAEPCVLRATIALSGCLDLTDTPGVTTLKPFGELFIATHGEDAVARIKQRGGARRLDCAIINFAVDQLEESGLAIRSIRAAFAEGDPIWTAPQGQPSGILDQSHVQIAVRDPSVIESCTAIALTGAPVPAPVHRRHVAPPDLSGS